MYEDAHPFTYVCLWQRLCQYVQIRILVERFNRLLPEIPVEVGENIKN